MEKSTLALAIVAGIVGLPYVQQASAAGFIEDSKATLSLRNLYFNQDYRSGTQPLSKAEEWGQGFVLNVQSGYTPGPVGFGVDAIGLFGVKLASNAGDNPGYTPQLFPLRSNGSAANQFSSLGLTGKARYSKTVAQVGTLLPKLPVLVYNDGRLLPATYEGGQITSNEIGNLTLTAGQIDRTRLRASTDLEGLSAGGAGTPTTNRFYFGGADYRVGKNLLLQYYYGALHNYYEQHFFGLTHTQPLPLGSLISDLRYFRSTSDGKNASAAGRSDGYRVADARVAGDPHKGEIDSDLWSAQFTWKVGGHALSVGYQENIGDSELARIFSGPGVTTYTIANRHVGGFIRPRERVWVGTYTYDFAALGVPGLTARLFYNKGYDISAAGSSRHDHEWERDARLEYVVQSGPLKNLNLAWWNASLRSTVRSQRDIDENRLVIGYTLPLF